MSTQASQSVIIITPQKNGFHLNFREVWEYRDLLVLFVKRDFISQYKQTVLGPLWFFIQPVFTTVIFTFIFGKVAGISTDGVPQILFYLGGITLWNYFSECLTKTSATFTMHADLLGKVYFPRIIIPLSVVISNLFILALSPIFPLGCSTFVPSRRGK